MNHVFAALVAAILGAIVAGGNAGAASPETPGTVTRQPKFTPLNIGILKLNACGNLTALQCASQCGTDLRSLSATYDSRYGACVKNRQDAVNNAGAVAISGICASYGLSDLNVCLGNSGANLTAAIKTKCESDGTPTLAQVSAKNNECARDQTALSKACSDAKSNRDALGQQHDAQAVAVRTAYTVYITELHKLEAIRGQIIRNNEFCTQNKCDQSLVLPVIPQIAIPQPVIK